MGVATRVVQAIVVLGATAGALLLASRYWPASTLEKQARAALEAPRDWPGSNAWADMALIGRDDLDAAGRQAELAAHVDAHGQWQAQRLQLIRQQAGREPGQWDLPDPPVLAEGTLPALPETLTVCGQAAQGRACLEAVRADPATAAAWVSEHAGFLSRLSGLSAHGHLRQPYEGGLNPSTRFPGILGRLGTGRVATALAHVQGGQARAVEAACRERSLARMLASQSDTLVAVTVGAAHLQGGGDWLAALLEGWPAGTPLPGACAAAGEPLPDSAIGLCAPMSGEFAMGRVAMAEGAAGMGDRLFASWFLDLGKSGNRSAAILGRGCLAPAQAAIAADTPVVLDDAGLRSHWHISCASNSIGCILTGIARPAYRDYVLRMQDAAASQRLLGAWLWLREQPPGTDLAAALDQLPAPYRSTARPVRASADGRALEVERYYDKQGDGPLQLPLPAAWLPAP